MTGPTRIAAASPGRARATRPIGRCANRAGRQDRARHGGGRRRDRTPGARRFDLRPAPPGRPAQPDRRWPSARPADTEPYSAPLRQLFDRFGQHAHPLSPTDVLFPEIARHRTEQRLPPELLRTHPSTLFLVDEAFICLAGQSVARPSQAAAIATLLHEDNGRFVAALTALLDHG